MKDKRTFLQRLLLMPLAILAGLLWIAPWTAPVPEPILLVSFATLLVFEPLMLPLRRRYRLLTFLGILIVGPLLIPLRPLPGVLPQDIADADSRFVEVDDVELHYKTHGQGEPVLVLLHPGQPMEASSWDRVIEPLAQHGTVITYDRPPGGLSARPPRRRGATPYATSAQADRVIGLLDALGHRRAVLVGNSSGGTVAALAALYHPERVEGLVLIAPGVYLGAGPGIPGWLRGLLATPQGHRLGRLLVRAAGPPGQGTWESFWHDTEKAGPAAEAAYLRTYRTPGWDAAFLELMRGMEPTGLAERLGEIEVPTLVVAPRQDRWVPVEQNEQLAQELPRGELAILEDCGHIPQEEKPEELLAAMTTFLESHGLAAAPEPVAAELAEAVEEGVSR